MVGYLDHFNRVGARSSTLRPLVACGVAALGIFAIDVVAPLGPAVAIAYATVVALAAWLGSPLVVAYVTLATSVLAMLEIVIATTNGPLAWSPIADRAVAIPAIWITAVVGLLLRRARVKTADGVYAYGPDSRVGAADGEHARLVAALAQADARAEAANRTKDEFLAVLSHELRNPLQTIAGWLDVLDHQTGADVAVQERARAAMRRSLQAQCDLVDDLLDASRIVSGGIAMETEVVDVGDAVATAVEALRAHADSRRIPIAHEAPAGALPVRGDRARLEQVVRNVLRNALKFTREGGGVDVTVGRAGARAEIAVRDTGEGIAPELVGRVFDRFWMADAGRTRRHGGLGLGLTIARHVVERHGGAITVSSAGVGAGTEVVVTLPLVVTLEAGEPCAGAAARRQKRRDDRLHGLRILVVEDDDAGRDALAESLRGRGAEVREAVSVGDGVALYDGWKPDVVVSDLGMPERDGLELARIIRARGADGVLRPPVLLALSGFTAKEDRDGALAAGFDDHLAKPLSGDGIVDAVLRHVTLLPARR